MKALQVIRIKPNPAGKDRTHHGKPTADQLGAEWVDFKNIGTTSVNLMNVELYHVAYPAGQSQGRWDKIIGFTGSLGPGKVVRVHSASEVALSALRQEDMVGADHHVFTRRDNYVWNNGQGDTAGLWDDAAEMWIDRASYDPYPPEGDILVRVGDKLVPAYALTRG